MLVKNSTILSLQPICIPENVLSWNHCFFPISVWFGYTTTNNIHFKCTKWINTCRVNMLSASIGWLTKMGMNTVDLNTCSFKGCPDTSIIGYWKLLLVVSITSIAIQWRDVLHLWSIDNLPTMAMWRRIPSWVTCG